MPPRFLTLAIVAFWLAAMGWLFVRDIWPELRPGERPPFTIDLSREAEGKKADAHWILNRSGQRIGHADSSTRYLGEDKTYELTTKITFDPGKSKYSGFGTEVELRRLLTTYRVSQEGELRKFQTELTIGVRVMRVEGVLDQPVQLGVEGDVSDGRFTPRRTVKGSDILAPFLNGEGQEDPIAAPSPESLLNPLHPWNRLHNVREGQHWHMTLFDPLTYLLPGLGKRPGARRLEAGVLEGAQEPSWDNHPDVFCRVIEYREHGADEPVARTWVRRDDGVVLRQELNLLGDNLTLQRDLSR